MRDSLVLTARLKDVKTTAVKTVCAMTGSVNAGMTISEMTARIKGARLIVIKTESVLMGVANANQALLESIAILSNVRMNVHIMGSA